MVRYSPEVEKGMRASDLNLLLWGAFNEGDFERAYFFSSQKPTERSTEDVESRAVLSLYKDACKALLAPDKGTHERYALRVLRKAEIFYQRGFINNRNFAWMKSNITEKVQDTGKEKFGEPSDDLSCSYLANELRYEQCVDVNRTERDKNFKIESGEVERELKAALGEVLGDRDCLELKLPRFLQYAGVGDGRVVGLVAVLDGERIRDFIRSYGSELKSDSPEVVRRGGINITQYPDCTRILARIKAEEVTAFLRGVIDILN